MAPLEEEKAATVVQRSVGVLGKKAMENSNVLIGLMLCFIHVWYQFG